MIIKIWYANWSVKGRKEYENIMFTRYLRYKFPEHTITINKNNPHIVFYSLFGGYFEKEWLKDKPITVLFVGENIHRLRANKFKRIYNQAVKEGMDYILQFTETAETTNNAYIERIPYWFYHLDFYKSQESSESYKIIKNFQTKDIKSLKKCCLIARSDIKNLRARILYNISEIMNVDCPSHIGHNCESIESRNQTKHEFCSEYLFNITPENSYGEGYVTEKIFEAGLAGNIPIYYGNIQEERKIINMERVLYVNLEDQKSIETLKNKIIRLLYDEIELQKFYNKNPFTANACEEIEKYEIKFNNLFQHCINSVLKK